MYLWQTPPVLTRAIFAPCRARLGTGHPGHKDLVQGHVLSDFHKADMVWVTPLLDACATALPFLAMGDDDRYQAAFGDQTGTVFDGE